MISVRNNFTIHNYPLFSSCEIAVGKNVRQHLIVCKFFLLTCTTYGKYLCENIMVVPTPKSSFLIKTYESTVNIVQLYNLAKLKKWKNKYTIQFLKVESPPLPPFTTYFGNLPIWTPLKMKKMPTPLKKFWEPKRPPIV